MRRWLRLSIIVALAGSPAALPQPGRAQDDTTYEDYEPEGGAESLESARGTGQGVVLGARGRAATVPDVYTVRRGDTLWDITGRYYGNPYEWPRVWSYNPEITNPHWIYPLDHIRLRAGANDAPAADLPTAASQPRRAEVGTVWLRDQGFLDQDAIDESGVIIGSPEEQMLLANYDEIYVRFDDGVEVRPNTDYTVYREIDEDERNEDESGTLVRIFGMVRIRSFDEDRNIARAVISETLDPIERGFRVGPIPRRFEMVPPQENAQDLEAEVVASLRPLRIHADQQVIFVNVGEEQGVKVGNRFFIVRAGDEWRQNLQSRSLEYGQVVEDPPEPDEEEYPPEVIAEGRVVNVRPNTAALFITRSIHEVEVGDRAEMRQGF